MPRRDEEGAGGGENPQHEQAEARTRVEVHLNRSLERERIRQRHLRIDHLDLATEGVHRAQRIVGRAHEQREAAREPQSERQQDLRRGQVARTPGSRRRA